MQSGQQMLDWMDVLVGTVAVLTRLPTRKTIRRLAPSAQAELATYGQIMGLSVLLGVINAIDMPTRQALVVDLVDQHEDLSNALALTSVMTNGARLVGPTLAGLLIVSLGEGRCFLLNGLSYLAILAAVGAMRRPPHPAAPPSASLLSSRRRVIRSCRPLSLRISAAAS